MCKALSFVDACTEEHFAAMSRSSPPGFRRAGAPDFFMGGGARNGPRHRVVCGAKGFRAPPAGGGPRFFICAGELNSPGIKVLPPAKRLYAPPGAGGSSTR